MHPWEAELALERGDSLRRIERLIGMRARPLDGSWNPETARLVALDMAMMLFRRNIVFLAEIEREVLFQRLHEARTLVVDERDSELEFIQREMEGYLPLAWNDVSRQVWLVAMDAMLPSPYRAAQCTVSAALAVDSGDFDQLTDSIRQRLLARLDEGSLHARPVYPLVVAG